MPGHGYQGRMDQRVPVSETCALGCGYVPVMLIGSTAPLCFFLSRKNTFSGLSRNDLIPPAAASDNVALGSDRSTASRPSPAFANDFHVQLYDPAAHMPRARIIIHDQMHGRVIRICNVG